MIDPLIAYRVRKGKRVATYRIVLIPYMPQSALQQQDAARCDICEREGRRFDDGAYCWKHWPVGEGV